MALVTKLRALYKLPFAVATSGIAATNFVDGMTAHSLLKIPIPILPDDTLRIPLQSKLATAIRFAACIIWDELPNTDNLNVLAADRSLRQMLHADMVFMGGKPLISAGDPRQIPPVIPNGTRADIGNHTIFNHQQIWGSMHLHALTRNMRVHNQGADAQFAAWLLQLGEGRLPAPNVNITPQVPPDHIELPYQMCIDTTRAMGDLLTESPTEVSVDGLLQFVYPNMETRHLTDPVYFTDRLIVAPTLQAAARINDELIARMPGQVREYASADTVQDSDHNQFYPSEFLNGLNCITGMPPHLLRLKIGMPVILLRNLRPPGHCNGTRYVIHTMHDNSIMLRAITGSTTGRLFNLPRIVNRPNTSDTHWTFVLRRVQFPIVPAFCISINKSQGQTVKRVGVYLPTPVFTHGQCYVASSRTGDPADLKYWVPDEPQYRYPDGSRAYVIKNIVWPEILFAARNPHTQVTEFGADPIAAPAMPRAPPLGAPDPEGIYDSDTDASQPDDPMELD